VAARITEDAVSWFDAERHPLLAATERACFTGRTDLAVRLADHQFAAQDRQARSGDSDRLWRLILTVADHAADVRLVAAARFHLAMTATWLGRAPDAIPLFDEAVAGYRQARDATTLAYCLGWRSYTVRLLGGFRQARHDAAVGLALARRSGARHAEALNLQQLGVALAHLGRDDESHRRCVDGLELARHLAEPLGEYGALYFFAGARFALGDHTRAIDLGRQALVAAAGAQHTWGQAATRYLLAQAYRALGRHREAIEALTLALPEFERYHSRSAYAMAIRKLGEAHRAIGDHQEAGRYLTRSADIFHDLGLTNWEERTHRLPPNGAPTDTDRRRQEL
jgi:tetratricopeptide (TPR) repeat protein